MAEDVHSEAPPVGEEVHLPEPSILPLLVAVFFTIALVGVTLFWPLTVFGAIVTLWLCVRWVRDTRRDVAELPLEH
jgi:Flp pilus assembly protein TadB